MPDDKEENSTLEASKVSIKIPPFWIEKPEMWFYTVEAQFKINGITAEETQFNYLVSQLHPDFLENIWDIVKSPDPNKYSKAKERLLGTFRESSSKRIQRLLTGLELGDMKPSQLLRKMRSLGDTDDISDKVLRTLWMDKMPHQIKNILIVSDESIEKLAAMADKIMEMNPRVELASVTEPQPTPYDALLSKISSLEQQIASLTVHSSRRGRSPVYEHARRRSRSRSRKRFDPNGKYCYFHYKFGNKCYPEKCKPPCNWKVPGNQQTQ